LSIYYIVVILFYCFICITILQTFFFFLLFFLSLFLFLFGFLLSFSLFFCFLLLSFHSFCFALVFINISINKTNHHKYSYCYYPPFFIKRFLLFHIYSSYVFMKIH